MDNTSIPKGGRGLRAEYPTITVRIPEGIKSTVQTMSTEYRLNGETNYKIICELVHKYQCDSTGTRDWTQFDRFLEEVKSSLLKSD